MLEKLHLHPRVLKFSGAGGVPNRFADSLNSLKVLNLSMYLYSMKEVAFAFCLARSSPNLQMLRVTGRSVKFANFSGSEPEVELLRSGQVISRGIFNFLVFVYKRPTGEVLSLANLRTKCDLSNTEKNSVLLFISLIVCLPVPPFQDKKSINLIQASVHTRGNDVLCLLSCAKKA
ncbi:hypothetical protein ACS0TY_005305 [Phlomoides rotata]